MDSFSGYRRLAAQHWPKAEWIAGKGRFASLAHCGVLTVMLYDTRAEVARAKKLIDKTGCCGECRKNHEIVDLGAGAP